MKSLRHTVFVLYVLAMLLAFLLPVPSVPVPDVPGGFDKLVHFGIFLGFALLLYLDRRPTVVRTLLVSFGFAAAIELVQAVLPYRSGDWRDFSAGALGAGVGVVVARLVARRPASAVR